MKIVLDTNVFVSGVFFTGPPYQILQAWRDGRLQIVLSKDILAGYRRVGERLAEQFSHVNLGPSDRAGCCEGEDGASFTVARSRL